MTILEIEQHEVEELQRLGDEAEALLAAVAVFAPRAYRCLAPYYRVQTWDDDGPCEDFRAASGAGRLLDALEALAGEAEAAAGEVPGVVPDWLSSEAKPGDIPRRTGVEKTWFTGSDDA